MATTISGTLSSFVAGETKTFSMILKIDGSAVDITNDTVTFYLLAGKDADLSAATLTKDADVATYGANGRAVFTLSKTDTGALTPGVYYWQVVWDRASGEREIFPDQREDIYVYL